MDSLFSVLDWIGAALIAAIFAMNILSHAERKAMRLLVLAASGAVFLRWFMWALTTDSSWWMRGLIGALIGALLFVGAPALWRKTKIESPQNVPSTGTPPAAPRSPAVVATGDKAPAFDLTENATVDAPNAHLEGVPSGLLRAGGNAKATFKDLTYIDSSKPLVWPKEDSIYAKMSNVQLRKKAIFLAKQLRAIHSEKEKATSDIRLPIAQLRALAASADAKADAGFNGIREQCLATGAAIAARENLQVVPREPRGVYLGSEAIILGRLSGVDPILNSAIALEALAAQPDLKR
jgi:hypothetical protein